MRALILKAISPCVEKYAVWPRETKFIRPLQVKKIDLLPPHIIKQQFTKHLWDHFTVSDQFTTYVLVTDSQGYQFPLTFFLFD